MRKIKVFDPQDQSVKIYNSVKDCADDLGYTSAQIRVVIRLGVTERSGLYGKEISYCI